MRKNLFTRVVPVVAVASALGLSALAGCAAQDTTATDTPGGVVEETIVEGESVVGGQDATKVMSEDEAKAIAFEDAGVLASDATNVKVEKKTEGGVEVYDIEFDAKGVSYDYVIDAKTGSLIEYDEEAVIVGGSTASGSTGSSSNSSSGSSGSSGSGSAGGTGSSK
ncbi:MAG: PepSY domain-containing protein [Eggerthellaceae bacterium]|nr:PepSY domain-containing protein [Eggerthellaceae bacterium]